VFSGLRTFRIAGQIGYKSNLSMETFLVLDTETTGLPADFTALPTNVDNWPRLVQVAWMVVEESGKVLRHYNAIVRPDGFTIPEGASRLHGIYQRYAEEEGMDVEVVLLDLLADMAECKNIVCHNVDFDMPVLAAELLRTFGIADFVGFSLFCTKRQTAALCKVPPRENENWPEYFRAPSLQELHGFCFQEGFANWHNAMHDVEATARCFVYIRKNNPDVFSSPFRVGGLWQHPSQPSPGERFVVTREKDGYWNVRTQED
jgi:DNA polymerase III epsilon subunit-like protein